MVVDDVIIINSYHSIVFLGVRCMYGFDINLVRAVKSRMPINPKKPL